MSLKIIIFDGSFKTTAFINRLAKGLAERHEVYILGFNEELKQTVKGVHYVPLGSNQSKFRFVKTSLEYALKEHSEHWNKNIALKELALQQTLVLDNYDRLKAIIKG